MVQFYTLSLCPGGYQPRLPLGGAGIAAQRSSSSSSSGKDLIGRDGGKADRQGRQACGRHVEGTKNVSGNVDYARAHHSQPARFISQATLLYPGSCRASSTVCLPKPDSNKGLSTPYSDELRRTGIGESLKRTNARLVFPTSMPMPPSQPLFSQAQKTTIVISKSLRMIKPSAYSSRIHRNSGLSHVQLKLVSLRRKKAPTAHEMIARMTAFNLFCFCSRRTLEH
jgi:hypothetical protein